jgi:hypothetical protein
MTSATTTQIEKFFGKPAERKAESWQVRKQPAPPPQPLLRRLFSRPEPTTYQRCLAVHLHFASPRGGLS